MFDLERSIAEWRQQMLAAGIQSPVPLEELEIHLREDIEQQTRSGRGEAEAFELAVQQLGQAHLVRGEFTKLDEPRDARRWKLLEITFGLLASVLPLWLCVSVLRFNTTPFANLTSGQQRSGLAAVMAFALLAWGGRLSCNLFPVVRSQRTRDLLTCVCAVPVMLWWITFMNLIVPHHDFTMGQFVLAFLWAFIAPGGAMIGLVWGMEAAARKKLRV
jgi:hypothetical protein